MDPIEGRATAEGTARYRRDPEVRDHLALGELITAARDAGGADHHFGVVELPYSLGMPEAFLRVNQAADGSRLTVLEAARRYGLYLMTSASLLGGRLAGLLARLWARASLGSRRTRSAPFSSYNPPPGLGPPSSGCDRSPTSRRTPVSESGPPRQSRPSAPSSSRRAESRPGRTATDRWAVFYPGPRRPRSRSRRSGRRARAGSQVIEPGVPAQSRSLGVTGSRRQ
jgi:hypothetical protein